LPIGADGSSRKKKDWWYTCLKHSLNNTLPSHGLKGKTPNNKRKWDDQFRSALEEHFEQLKSEAEPISTGVVRELTGETTLRDADCEVDYLPSHVSKRSCYGRFCLERGWMITSTNKGVAKAEPMIGREQQDIPSLTAYMSFWNKYHENLKVTTNQRYAWKLRQGLQSVEISTVL
jgi:hypothetical protein